MKNRHIILSIVLVSLMLIPTVYAASSIISQNTPVVSHYSTSEGIGYRVTGTATPNTRVVLKIFDEWWRNVAFQYTNGNGNYDFTHIHPTSDIGKNLVMVVVEVKSNNQSPTITYTVSSDGTSSTSTSNPTTTSPQSEPDQSPLSVTITGTATPNTRVVLKIFDSWWHNVEYKYTNGDGSYTFTHTHPSTDLGKSFTAVVVEVASNIQCSRITYTVSSDGTSSTSSTSTSSTSTSSTSTSSTSTSSSSTSSTSTSSTLPNSLIGDDYLRYYANADPYAAWTTHYMNKFTQWKCNTARLGFAFGDAQPTSSGKHTHSLYVEWKMDAVLGIFDSYGIKVILDLHNVGDHIDYMGSWGWINNWKAIAKHYKGDTRIAGFNIFNEPNKATWAHSGPLGNIDTKEKFLQVCKYLIDEIRAIDPTRKIFFPTTAGMGIGYDDPTTTYYAMNAAGIIAKGNIVMDISHPYYWENQWDLERGLSPEQVVSNLMHTQIDPAINLWGAQNLWIGETFARQYIPGTTKDLQIRFVKALVNACLERGIGLQIWAYFAQQDWNSQALYASNY